MSNLTLNKTNKDTGEAIGTVDLEIRAYPIAEPKGSTKGFASITIDGLFGVHGISIVEGQNGLFMSMPQAKDSQNKYRDIFHPITSEGRKAMQDAVLGEFSAALDEMLAQKESALDKIRESARATKEKAAPAADKAAKEKAAKRTQPEH